jgi:hypothetical protein
MRLSISILAILVGLTGLGTVSVQGVSAQSASSLQPSSSQQPLQIFRQEDPNDPSNLFTNRASTTSLLNLINQLQLLNGRTSSEFAAEQDENFNAAVEAFRQKQQRELQTKPAPAASPAPQ